MPGGDLLGDLLPRPVDRLCAEMLSFVPRKSSAYCKPLVFDLYIFQRFPYADVSCNLQEENLWWNILQNIDLLS